MTIDTTLEAKEPGRKEMPLTSQHLRVAMKGCTVSIDSGGGKTRLVVTSMFKCMLPEDLVAPIVTVSETGVSDCALGYLQSLETDAPPVGCRATRRKRCSADVSKPSAHFESDI